MEQYTYLAHHGVKGQKHGERQYQNPDGSLTPLGRIHYGVGEARKKAVSAIKSAPSKAGKIIKNTPKNVANVARDLARQRRESVSINRARKHKRIVEKEKAKAKRFREEQQERAAKLAAREAKKNLNEVVDEIRTSNARRKVEKLVAKQARITELADLEARAKYLKSSMKAAERRAKRDARKKYSKQDIRNMSDDEIQSRINRLKAEATLRGLEAERAAPRVSAGAKWVGGILSDSLSKSTKELLGAKAVSIGKNVFNLSDAEINEYVKLTKKK